MDLDITLANSSNNQQHNKLQSKSLDSISTSTLDCLQTKPIAGFKKDKQYLPKISKKLREINETEKFREIHYSGAKSLEEAFEIGEKSLLLGNLGVTLKQTHKEPCGPLCPTVSITITSPEGKLKHILSESKNKRTTKIRLGIPTNSEFWLPKVTSPVRPQDKGEVALHDDDEIKKNSEEVNISLNEETKPEDNSCNKRDTKTETEVVESPVESESANISSEIKTEIDPIEIQFEKALEQKGLKFTGSTKELTHVCHTLDETWVAVNKQSIIIFRQKTESINFICFRNVLYLMVDSNYQILCLVLVPEAETECNIIVEVVPGEVTKTESLITSIIFASSRYYQAQSQISQVKSDDSIRLISKPLLELPTCKSMLNCIGEDCAKRISYCGIVYLESVDSETNITDELMMQIGAEKYKPVDLNIKGCILTINPICGTCAESAEENNRISLDVKCTTISRTETPRPHTVSIKTGFKSFNLSASNDTTADELMTRLRSLKDLSTTIYKQPAYLVLTEYFLFLFSVFNSKKLLIQAPSLNFISLGRSDKYTIFIANDSKEADESVSNVRSTSWWKLTFLKESECTTFNEVLSTCTEYELLDC